MTDDRRCSRCGRDRIEIQHETLWNKRGFPYHGKWYCLNCFLKTREAA